MTLRLILTDGDGVSGLAASFGAFINTAVAATFADAQAAAANAAAAAVSATDAAASDEDAQVQATAAAGSAASAAAQAGNALTSATAASTSATNAATSSTAATASATAAATSKTNAATSATAASTSATNSATSATASAGSASAAAATLAASMLKANNLSDVANLATARSNLGLGILSGKNKLINGSFLVNQRAYASGTATTAANQYTLDRWRVVVSGQSLAYAASGNGFQVTAPAGGLEQVIEANNIEGGSYVLSWAGTATCTVNGTAVANGGNITLPANTNATVRIIGGTCSLIQLEAGTVPTAFERLLVPVLLWLCRYYWSPLAVGGTAFSTAGGTVATLYDFPPMRVAPTVTVTTPSFSNASSLTVTGIAQSFLQAQAVCTAAGACFFSGILQMNAEL